jgi:predicted GNAT family acetyltransferase
MSETAMLKVREYHRGETFWSEVAHPLSARRVLTNVFVGVAFSIRVNPMVGLLRYGVFDDGRPVLGALRTPPFRLNLADFGNGEAGAALLAAELAEREIDLPGVVGEERLAERFTNAWCVYSGQKPDDAIAQGRKQVLYEIEEVEFPEGVAGRMRPARPEERDLLVEWEQGFANDADLPATERDQAFVVKMVDAGLGEGSFFCWEVDGAPVATARLRRISTIGARVSGVYTPPANRGRGYAAALTAALSKSVLDRKQYCCLFADASNALTNRIYQRIGYAQVARFTDILFSEASTRES